MTHQWKKNFIHGWFVLEGFLDDAAEQAQMSQMMIVLAVINTSEVVTWCAEFCQNPMSFPLFLLLFGEPAHLLMSIVAMAAASAIDATCYYTAAGTEFGAALCIFGATMSSMFLWGLHLDEPPQYVPKRLRYGPSFLSRATKSSVGAISRVSLRAVGAVLLMIQLTHLSIKESAGIPMKHQERSEEDEPFLDQDDETEEPFASLCDKYKRACQPTMLWDLKVTEENHEPTKFELFIRFLLVLKGGLDLMANESNPIVAWQLILYSLSGDMNRNSEDHQYDADSVLIAIDNCSSRCITNSMKDFIGKPVKAFFTAALGESGKRQLTDEERHLVRHVRGRRRAVLESETVQESHPVGVKQQHCSGPNRTILLQASCILHGDSSSIDGQLSRQN
ncbi:unknown protein [Seminavis robusta]|uniref:Uncharacterized protein n=1 Tax=Seminavis robusta TaxID=568900 RepID=A0A9N8F0B8_9STRA|nr:unknown protein [Seminavis robusta]|eukprot:Sro2788_g337100.1 n/a (391) ;mRNA; r:1916-3231